MFSFSLSVDFFHSLFFFIDVFREDPDYLQNENQYRAIRREILGEDEETEEREDEVLDDEDNDQGDMGSEDHSPHPSDEASSAQSSIPIVDHTNLDLASFRKTVYLTIMSSLNFEEACHKLLRIELGPGQDVGVLFKIRLFSERICLTNESIL